MRKSQLGRELLIIVHYLRALRTVLHIMRDPFLVVGYAFSVEWNQRALSRGLRFTFIATPPSKCCTWSFSAMLLFFFPCLYEGTQKEIYFCASLVFTASCAGVAAIVAQKAKPPALPLFWLPLFSALYITLFYIFLGAF